MQLGGNCRRNRLILFSVRWLWPYYENIRCAGDLFVPLSLGRHADARSHSETAENSKISS
jgi:hypothetical protein